MSGWLKEVVKELEDMGPANYIEPLEEARPNEDRIGQVSEEAKRIYSLARHYERAALENLLDTQFARSEDDVLKKRFQALRCHKKSEILQEMFWAIVRDEFGLWDKPAIGIRKGWLVVCIEGPETPEDLLRRLFG